MHESVKERLWYVEGFYVFSEHTDNICMANEFLGDRLDFSMEVRPSHLAHQNTTRIDMQLTSVMASKGTGILYQPGCKKQCSN